MENPIFSFFSFLQPISSILKTRHQKAAKPSLASAKPEEISSIKLFVSFTLYLTGGVLMDYGWHHHLGSFFLLGGFIVLAGLIFLIWPLIKEQNKRCGQIPEQEGNKAEGSPESHSSFLSLKM